MISAQAWADAQRLWNFQLMHQDPQPCDVAVGLGSHDLGVADTTAALFHKGLAPLIVFTGATSPTTRSEMPRGEAEHYRERAIELGVPASAILVEPRARNTGQNIIFTRDLLNSQGMEVKSVLLVSKPYEERRASATVRKLWPDVDVVSASTPVSFTEYVDSIHDARLVIDMLVGAQQRLMIYPREGFMVAVDVPEDVIAAYERLCVEGFTSRLVRAR
ncbi:YdcF family protein [Streptomyces sp. NBC_01016]|uniref:YdcF family protein n=1 Tax=Streptomyces sp. NBC_01016 TaxID=2903720 RepID=UPI002250DC05|nr:YdcF family protein [Streptomyces sp. NBC_01016]MCX4827788.1 YdcF family protein [Streptomyces sp. NBC_01016]